ncbi:MAG: FixH family protein [Thermoanaerobaculia bacterium]
MPSTASNTWYRNPLVWMLILFPAWSVIAGVSTVVLAFQVFDGVVVDDYYARGKAINVVIERDLAAQRRGITGVATFAPGAGARALEVQLTALDVAALPARLKLAFLHSTHGGADAQVELQRTAPGMYHAVVPPLVRGKFYLQIEAEDWRIVGALRQPGETAAALGPSL